MTSRVPHYVCPGRDSDPLFEPWALVVVVVVVVVVCGVWCVGERERERERERLTGSVVPRPRASPRLPEFLGTVATRTLVRRRSSAAEFCATRDVVDTILDAALDATPRRYPSTRDPPKAITGKGGRPKRDSGFGLRASGVGRRASDVGPRNRGAHDLCLSADSARLSRASLAHVKGGSYL
jgi:hypothetical protein